MFAKNMESILTSLCEKSDVSHGAPNEAAERFDALRRYGRLPCGREKRGESSTNADVAAAISGLTTPAPNWAGHAGHPSQVCVQSVGPALLSLALQHFRSQLNVF
jgi:hypothetical protein